MMTKSFKLNLILELSAFSSPFNQLKQYGTRSTKFIQLSLSENVPSEQTNVDFPQAGTEASNVESLKPATMGSAPEHRGGVGSQAQSIASQNLQTGQTVSPIVQDSKEPLEGEKTVPKDATTMQSAASPAYEIEKSGVAAHELSGADKNVNLAGPTTTQQGALQNEHLTTISEILKEAAHDLGNKPITPSEAAAIRSAEAHARGAPGQKGGIGSHAQSAANRNLRTGSVIPTPTGWAINPVAPAETVGHVLEHVEEELPADKIVTPEDAAAIQRAEQRRDPSGHVEKGGIAAHAQAAVAHNRSVQ